MSKVQTGNLVHDATVAASEGVHQAAVTAAATQAAANTAAITHYRNCLASALTNSCGSDTFRAALRSLGVSA